MLKKFIAPLQQWLLKNGQCVGCGMPLSQGKTEKTKKGLTKVTCKCGRIYIKENEKYRRALFEEI